MVSVRLLRTACRLAGIISILSMCGCPFGPGGDAACLVDNRGFWRAEVINECAAVDIADTKFIDLDGLFQVQAIQSFTLRRNAELESLDALSGARAIIIDSGNASLNSVDVELFDLFLLRDASLSEVKLLFRGTTARITLDGNAEVTSIDVDCAVACGLDLNLASIPPAQLVMTAGVTFSVQISTTIVDHTLLEGYGIPERVVVEGEQDDEQVGSYLEWLRSEGFSGEFLVCPQTLDDCSPR